MPILRSTISSDVLLRRHRNSVPSCPCRKGAATYVRTHIPPQVLTCRSRLVAWLFAYAGGLPLLAVLLWAIIFKPAGHKLHVTILGLAISLLLTSFLTDIVKNSVGRPRPDLIARCKPRDDTPKHSLVTIDICTQTHHHRLHDGWRSFPSGHSSFAFSGLGYLALYTPALHPTSQSTKLD